jgi:hypothetical protein
LCERRLWPCAEEDEWRSAWTDGLCESRILDKSIFIEDREASSGLEDESAVENVNPVAGSETGVPPRLRSDLCGNMERNLKIW